MVKAKREAAGLPKLGGWRGGVEGKRGRAVALANADAFATRVGPMIRAMRDRGMSQSAIARELTAGGIVLPRGGTGWSATAVRRALERLEP